MLDGLEADDLGASPAARRRALAALSDAALGERLARLAGASRTFDAAPIAAAAALPLGEVVASPFALRMCALGVEAGASSRHRELRRHVDWTESISPDVADPDHDVWERGALKTGKYQGFTAESPVAIYDPAHVSKWGPHEMLHRAVGFFYRPGLSRWELYLGARLNELLPVTTFYGAEQAMRLDEGAFDRAAAGRRPRARVEDARWRVEDDAALAARARRAAPVFREGLRHLERELAAIDEELLRGVRVRAVHPFLDTSSDATAYVVGHHARLTQEAVERVLAPRGEPDVGAYRDRIEGVFDRLLFGRLDGAIGDRRAAEACDLLLRAAHLGEGVEVDLEPLFDERDPDVIRARLPDRIGDEEAALILEDGTDRGLALDQLADGLAHVLPRSVALDGVPAQQAFYARAGFESVGETCRWEGSVPARRSAAIRPARPGDLPGLIAMDTAANGYNKHAFLSGWLADTPDRRTLVHETDGRRLGFVTWRRCRSGVKLGPLAADTIDTAWTLVTAASAAVDEETLIFDVPAAQTTLTECARDARMHCSFVTARMIRGDPPRRQPLVATPATLELG